MKVSNDAISYCPEALERTTKVKAIDQLIFETDELAEEVAHLCRRVRRISTRQKWLGVYYKRDLEEKRVPKLIIRWIDEEMGYGIFADELILPGRFIGEYVGIVRRHDKNLDRYNDYCFEYPLKKLWFTP